MWIWVVDYQQAAHDLQMTLYGQSNIVIPENRTSLLDIYNGANYDSSSDDDDVDVGENTDDDDDSSYEEEEYVETEAQDNSDETQSNDSSADNSSDSDSSDDGSSESDSSDSDGGESDSSGSVESDGGAGNLEPVEG